LKISQKEFVDMMLDYWKDDTNNGAKPGKKKNNEKKE